LYGLRRRPAGQAIIFRGELSFGKTRFNTAVGNLLGYLARDLIFPLENIHPELRERN
jgi:hypothetical protein